LELVPNEKFVTNNLNDLHLHIINSVLKNTDNISCYKQLSFNETTHTNSGKYSIPDQIYTTNLMKRSVSAYKFYRDRLNKESEKYNKEIDEKKRKESEEIKNQRQTEDGEALRDDDKYAYVAAWEYEKQSSFKLHKEELKYENIKIAQRSYK
jgi:hypothetical protein